MAGRAAAVAAHEEESPQREAAALVNVDVARVEAAARLRTVRSVQAARARARPTEGVGRRAGLLKSLLSSYQIRMIINSKLYR